MVINMSVSLMFNESTINVLYFDSLVPPPVCFTLRFLLAYSHLTYLFLISFEVVNIFVKVVLVFERISQYPLKVSLVAWSEH